MYTQRNTVAASYLDGFKRHGIAELRSEIYKARNDVMKAQAEQEREAKREAEQYEHQLFVEAQMSGAYVICGNCNECWMVKPKSWLGGVVVNRARNLNQLFYLFRNQCPSCRAVIEDQCNNLDEAEADKTRSWLAAGSNVTNELLVG